MLNNIARWVGMCHENTFLKQTVTENRVIFFSVVSS